MRDAPSSPGSDGRPGDSPDDDRTVIRPADAAAPASWQVPPVLSVPPSAGTPPVLEHGDGNTLPVGTRLGEFELVGVVGVGGFGIVYLALGPLPGAPGGAEGVHAFGTWPCAAVTWHPRCR